MCLKVIKRLIKLKQILNEYYKEVEFVCYNTDFSAPDYLMRQEKLFKELKSINGLLAYRQDFSDNNYKEISLAVVILDKNKEQELLDIIEKLSEKYGIKIDLFNDLNNSQVDSIVKQELDGIEL